MGETKSSAIPDPQDPLLQKIQFYILDKYEPVSDPANATLRMTTQEVYNAISKFYNTLILSEESLALWLHEKGFSFFDCGNMRFEWLFKSRTE